MKLAFKLKWIEGKDEWHLLSPLDNSFVYELRDCKNMRRLFNNPDKTIDRLITIDVQPFSKEMKSGQPSNRENV